MMCNLKILLVFIFIAALQGCRIFKKSWDDIYKEQQDLFRKNQSTFQLSLNEISKINVSDTAWNRTQFPQLIKNETVTKNLIDLGIKEILVMSNFHSGTDSCVARVVRFVSDSLWYFEEFNVFTIENNPCDTRSKKDYHWQAKGSEHKHSFGQGNGWFLYSDTDQDPW